MSLGVNKFALKSQFGSLDPIKVGVDYERSHTSIQTTRPHGTPEVLSFLQYSTELRNLISSAVFEDMGHKVVLDGENSHIELRKNDKAYAIIPLRCEGRLRFLDYLCAR